MDRSILAIFRVSRYLPGACRWVFISGLCPWHPTCFPHCCETAIAAALPAMHRSNNESLAQCVHKCVPHEHKQTPLSCVLLLFHLAWAMGQRESGNTYMALSDSNCSTVTVTEVGCGRLLIGYRQHPTVWHQQSSTAESTGDPILDAARSPMRFGLADDSRRMVDWSEPSFYITTSHNLWVLTYSKFSTERQQHSAIAHDKSFH